MTSLKECMEFVLMFTGGSVAVVTAMFAAMVYYDNRKYRK